MAIQREDICIWYPIHWSHHVLSWYALGRSLWQRQNTRVNMAQILVEEHGKDCCRLYQSLPTICPEQTGYTYYIWHSSTTNTPKWTLATNWNILDNRSPNKENTLWLYFSGHWSLHKDRTFCTLLKNAKCRECSRSPHRCSHLTLWCTLSDSFRQR